MMESIKRQSYCLDVCVDLDFSVDGTRHKTKESRNYLGQAKCCCPQQILQDENLVSDPISVQLWPRRITCACQLHASRQLARATESSSNQKQRNGLSIQHHWF